jgi:hypothetical protein
MTATVADPPKISSPVSRIPSGLLNAPAMINAGKMPSTNGSDITVARSRVPRPTRCSSRSATGCLETLIPRQRPSPSAERRHGRKPDGAAPRARPDTPRSTFAGTAFPRLNDCIGVNVKFAPDSKVG